MRSMSPVETRRQRPGFSAGVGAGRQVGRDAPSPKTRDPTSTVVQSRAEPEVRIHFPPAGSQVRTRPHGFGNLPPCEPRARTAGSRIGTPKTITLRNEAERPAAVHTPEGIPLPPNALAKPASTFRVPDAGSRCLGARYVQDRRDRPSI